ncbi:MAG: hypothetical protein WC551_10495 [Patescibacteria group bacterium]
MRRQSSISRYQQGKLTSQAVGVPQEDKSGQIYAQAATKVGNVLQERQDKADTLSAMSKFGDFQVEYGIAKEKAQQKYRDNPKDYVQAVRDESDKLLTKYSDGMESGSAQKFRSITTSALAQDADNLVSWANGRNREIILGNGQKGYSDLGLAAETATTPEALKALLGDEKSADEIGEWSLAAQDKRMRAFVNEAGVLSLHNDARTVIVKNALMGSMMANASKTYGDLARGKYDDILTPVEVKTFMGTSHELMRSNATQEQFKSLATGAVELSQLSDAVAEKQVGVAEINRRLMWAETNKDRKDVNGEPIISPSYIQGLSTLRDIALGLDVRNPQEKKIDATAFTEDLDRRWDAFLADKGKKGKIQPKDYDDILKLYTDLIQGYREGIIDPGKYETKKKLLDTKLATKLGKKNSVKSLQDVLDKAGTKSFWGWDNSNDVYSHGYSIIKNYVDKRTDLSIEEKRNFRDQYLLTYTEAVKKLPEEMVNNVKNPEAFATALLLGEGEKVGLIDRMAVYQHPETRQPLMYGQITTYQGKPVKFLGANPQSGKLRWAVSKKVIEGMDNR